MGWSGFVAVNRVTCRAAVLVKRCAFLYIACRRRDPLTRRLDGLRGQRGPTCRIACLRVNPYRHGSGKKRERHKFDNSRASVSLRHVAIGLHTANIEPSDVASAGIFFVMLISTARRQSGTSTAKATAEPSTRWYYAKETSYGFTAHEIFHA